MHKVFNFMPASAMKEALFYQQARDGNVRCLLCPHKCTIANGKTGICKVRRNVDGTLLAETYCKVSALHFDPIEKKPLYHFHPGTNILSVGSLGCNLACTFCQNCEISQADVSGCIGLKDYPPEEIVSIAQEKPDNIGIAFTYNEPIIFYEYMIDIAKLAKEKGLKTVLVSNGFINRDPLLNLLPYIDAFNIDLKAFREEFYRKLAGAKLAPVLASLKSIHQAGKHLEITNLIIPTLNDERSVFKEMIDWIYTELGENTVLHLSRYFPYHKLRLESTPVDTLLEFYSLARHKLHNVYLGNIAMRTGSQTRCEVCDELLINRQGYQTTLMGVTKDGRCIKCGQVIQNLVL